MQKAVGLASFIATPCNTLQHTVTRVYLTAGRQFMKRAVGLASFMAVASTWYGLQCVAVRCSVLQCVAVCCSVLQCVALY